MMTETVRGDLAQMAAMQLREDIIQGVLPPGTPLREQVWSQNLNVSRNTLREALRILAAQGLIDQRANYGATVRALSDDEVREIYAIRRTLELEGVRRSGSASRQAMEALVEAANMLQRAALADEWDQVGTLSLALHRAIVQLIGSPRLDELFTTVAAQARLAFSFAGDARDFQAEWVGRDVEICRLICVGRLLDAERALSAYLAESEQIIQAVTRARTLAGPAAIFPPPSPAD